MVRTQKGYIRAVSICASEFQVKKLCNVQRTFLKWTVGSELGKYIASRVTTTGNACPQPRGLYFSADVSRLK